MVSKSPPHSLLLTCAYHRARQDEPTQGGLQVRVQISRGRIIMRSVDFSFFNDCLSLLPFLPFFLMSLRDSVPLHC